MKALLLLSGGFDSPVAGHLLQNKDVELVALNFSQEPATDHKETEKAMKLAEILGINRFIWVKMGQQLAELVNKCNHKLYYVLQRRLMLRVAEKIAAEEGCDYLVTGDNLAQVGSQTLSNMAVIDRATSMTVLRPILCNDKVETINIAKEIGTHDASCGPELCALFGPKHPATSSRIEFVEKEEMNIDVDKMVADVIATVNKEEIKK